MRAIQPYYMYEALEMKASMVFLLGGLLACQTYCYPFMAPKGTYGIQVVISGAGL